MTKVAKERIPADRFVAWLDGMKACGFINYDVDAARLLDINYNNITLYRRDGVDRKTWLACCYLMDNRGLLPPNRTEINETAAGR